MPFHILAVPVSRLDCCGVLLTSSACTFQSFVPYTEQPRTAGPALRNGRSTPRCECSRSYILMMSLSTAPRSVQQQRRLRRRSWAEVTQPWKLETLKTCFDQSHLHTFHCITLPSFPARPARSAHGSNGCCRLSREPSPSKIARPAISISAETGRPAW